MCKLSIITVNYNNADGLAQTIESIVKQKSKDFEFIIIDGGSTDKSIGILEANKQHVNYWVSEKDEGVYNAMNKGLSKANGLYYFFLNSGDCLKNAEIIENVLPLLTGEFIIYGNIEISEPAKAWEKKYPDELLFSYFIEDTLPHSAGAFIHRNAFVNELSVYDESLKISADWKWFLLAIFKFQYSYKHIDKLIGIFDYSGISAQPKNHHSINLEKQKILKEYFPLLFKDVSHLLKLKHEYQNLLNSRFIKFYLKIKERMPRKKHYGELIFQL